MIRDDRLRQQHPDSLRSRDRLYTYDAYGQRLRKTENSVTKYYVTSGPSTLAEYDGSAMQRDYTPFGENYTAAGNDDVPYQFTP